MSSMRNAVQRRPHRERAQPLERRRLGLLEKHKDYKLRAADYNKKKDTLKSLRQKAADRNEDEFYFGMMSRKGPGSKMTKGKKWDGTVQGDRGTKAMDVDTVRLLKTQDMNYIRTMRQTISKEIPRLEEQLVLTRGFDRLDENDADDDDDDDDDDSQLQPRKRKVARKVVFTYDEEERQKAIEDAEESQKHNVSEVQDDAEDEDTERATALRRLKRQLANARKKVKALDDAEKELETQKAKMAKTATSGGLTRRGHKRMVRKRKR